MLIVELFVDGPLVAANGVLQLRHDVRLPQQSFQLFSTVARRVQTTDDGAHARAPDIVYPNARFFDYLQSPDVRVAPRTSAGQDEAHFEIFLGGEGKTT